MKNKILSGVLLTLSVLFALNGISEAGKAKGKIDNTVDLSSSGNPSAIIHLPADGDTVGGRVDVSFTFYAADEIQHAVVIAGGITLAEWWPAYGAKISATRTWITWV